MPRSKASIDWSDIAQAEDDYKIEFIVEVCGTERETDVRNLGASGMVGKRGRLEEPIGVGKGKGVSIGTYDAVTITASIVEIDLVWDDLEGSAHATKQGLEFLGKRRHDVALKYKGGQHTLTLWVFPDVTLGPDVPWVLAIVSVLILSVGWLLTNSIPLAHAKSLATHAINSVQESSRLRETTESQE